MNRSPESAAPRAARGLSFRTRLLLALAGSVALLALTSLVVVSRETTRQIDLTTTRTAQAGSKTLSEIERFRRADLERVASRIAGSIRIVAAFDAAMDDGDTDAFLENVRYELTLAEFGRGLVVFGGQDGRPFAALENGVPLADADRLALAPAGPSAAAGTSRYQRVGDRLYSVMTHELTLFQDPVGTLTLGFPIDADLASRLGDLLGAEVCFASGGRCLASTAAVTAGPLAARMLEAPNAARALVVAADTHRFAIVSTPLPSEVPTFAVLAVPLDSVLAPLNHLLNVQMAATAGALVVAVFLGMLLSRRLTTPIRSLVTATERVRRGDYDFAVAVPHRDELGALADAFNQMTQGLLLKERYRSVLDKVVSPSVAEELMKGDIHLGGETRELTTLFADVRGFTHLTEAMDPQDVIAMLNEWLDLAAEIIQNEGGVVDKYVGDQVMAIFGAPVPHPDHAARAVRAGVRLRDDTESLNARRREASRPALSIGIGINTGAAVAGNMGSSDRLNYTVLGTSVNAAARLCAEADAGQLLVGDTTYAATAHLMDATPLAPRLLKGLSQMATPYLVHTMRDTSRTTLTIPGATAVVCACAAALLTCATPARAQVFDPPTLREMGVEYRSPGGLVQIRPSVKLTANLFVPQADGAGLIREDGAFLDGRARLFGDVFIGRRLYGSVEFRIDRGMPPAAGGPAARIQQAFVRFTPNPTRAFSVQAGQFVAPFGTYPQRAHTATDAFIRPPLFYDHRTVMQATFVPAGADGVFTWKDTPSLRVDGRPVVWDVPYPVGVSADASAHGLSATAAVLTSGPSADPEDWHRMNTDAPIGPTFTGRAAWQATPEWQVGSSYSRGSYLRLGTFDAKGAVNVGRQTQELRAVDATWRHGYTDVRAELTFNRWDVARVANAARDVSYYVEARRTLAPGLFTALRYGAVRFRDLASGTGRVGRWDYDITRWQAAAGYRLGRNHELRAEFMRNHTTGTTDPKDNMLSLQWWLSL